MSDKPFRWHIFQDGHRELVRGYDRIELSHMERTHGRLCEILTPEELDKISRRRDPDAALEL